MKNSNSGKIPPKPAAPFQSARNTNGPVHPSKSSSQPLKVEKKQNSVASTAKSNQKSLRGESDAAPNSKTARPAKPIAKVKAPEAGFPDANNQFKEGTAALSSAKVDQAAAASTTRKENQRSQTEAGVENIKRKKPSGKKIFLWCSLAVLVLMIAFAIFVYVRTTSFVNSTLGGYNAPSLLTPSKPTQKPATSIPVSEPTLQSAASLATPNVSRAPVSTATPQPSPTPNYSNAPEIVQRIRRGERLSVLVLGYGGVGHDGAFLTDTIMEITYDPVRNAVSMVNIPRDLYTFIPYGGPKIGYWSKINAAFAQVMESTNPSIFSSRYRYTNDQNKLDAAVNLTKDIVEQVTGIPVDYWAVFNFDGFRQLVNAIGGIDVVIDTTFDDYDYPANDNPEIDASVMHIHFDAGLEHMNGERAIEYSRSRHSQQDGSDFGRSKRQMKVVQAVKEKIARPEILFKSFDIMSALQGNIRTSLTINEVVGLADYFRGNEGAAKARNLLFVSQILSSNFLYDQTSASTGYILLPQAGQGNYKEIQDWLQMGLNAPELRSENLKVQVQNGTGVWKWSTQATTDLRGSGFNLLPSIWANTITQTTTILDYTQGKAVYSLKALTDLFPDAEVKSAIRSAPNPEGPDLVVILGKDYVSVPSKPDAAASNTGSKGVQANSLNGTTPASSSNYGYQYTPVPTNRFLR